jgi:hypothetical protein
MSECVANSKIMTYMGGKPDAGCSEENLFKWHLVQHESIGGEKKKCIPSIFKDESTGSCIYLWKLGVAVATYVSICIVYRILPSFAF